MSPLLNNILVTLLGLVYISVKSSPVVCCNKFFIVIFCFLVLAQEAIGAGESTESLFSFTKMPIIAAVKLFDIDQPSIRVFLSKPCAYFSATIFPLYITSTALV